MIEATIKASSTIKKLRLEAQYLINITSKAVRSHTHLSLNLGSLTSTCPANMVVFPMIFGQTQEECSDDVEAVGFDMTSTLSIILIGKVTATSTSFCPKLSNN